MLTRHGQAVFETLYTECLAGVYRYCLAHVQDVQAAQDITSETFFRAWRAWPPRSLDGHAPKAWLFQIARNLVIDQQRASQRHPNLPLDEELPAGSQWANPGSHAHLDKLAVRMALAGLPERDQDVLSMRLAGLSNHEIAAVLGLSEAAAGMACLRALQRLREILEE